MKRYDDNYKSAKVFEFFRLNQEGFSLRAIARKYGMSHHTVKNWLDEFKLPIITWSSSEFKDISNQKFGLLTAIMPLDKKSEKGSFFWLCYCDCDVDKVRPLEVDGGDLRRGRKTHCGCNHPTKIDISGQRFGHLTAIRDSGKRINNHVVWEALCDCGQTQFATYGDLTSGHTKSCGCQKPKGEAHYKWSGGTSDLKVYLRSMIKEWKQESLRKSNYRCCITGNIYSPDDPLEIHHLTKSFDFIFKESLTIHNLQYYPNRGDYTKEQLDLLTNTFIRKHAEYGAGAVLTRSLHNEFHSMFYQRYGYDVPASEFDYFLKTQEINK